MTRRTRRALALAATVATLALVGPIATVGLVGAAGTANAQQVPIDSGPLAGAEAEAGATGGGATASAANGTAAAAPPVVVGLRSTSPITPPATFDASTVTVVITVRNNTNQPLQHLQISAVRDSPIIKQSALDAMIAKPIQPLDDTLTQTLPTTDYPNPIAPHASTDLHYQFPASKNSQSAGVCLCQDGVYPIDLSVSSFNPTKGVLTPLGWVQTYLNSVSVFRQPVPVSVSWLWPLIDRPHRLTVGSTFLDDDLATSIATGGRLDRALGVLEKINPASDVTVVIDPELIDEIVAMRSGYVVQQAGKTTRGVGSAAALTWLTRLQAAITGLHVVLTPWTDPAINAVTAAGLAWSPMPTDMSTRVATALGRPITAAQSALAWPPGETVTPAALVRLEADGASTVLLNDTALPLGGKASPPPPAVAPISGAAALVTSTALQARIKALLKPDGSQLAGLPALLAGLALRTVQEGAQPSFVVMTPDRYVDTTPATAAAVITATTTASWVNPIAATDVAATIKPVDHGGLVAPNAQHLGGSSVLLARARSTAQFAAEFGSALQSTNTTTTPLVPAAATLLASFPTSVQLCQSAAWADPHSGNLGAASYFDTLLAGQISQLTGRVQLLRPSNGTYSLASSSAPLLVTVVNNLPVPIRMRVSIISIGGVPGFRADDSGVQTLPPNSNRTIKVQAHVTRSGHFKVDARLIMPAGGVLGTPMQLSVYSSALGTIGVIITVVASAILVLALINRFLKRWRHRRQLLRLMDATRSGQSVPAGPISASPVG